MDLKQFAKEYREEMAAIDLNRKPRLCIVCGLEHKNTVPTCSPDCSQDYFDKVNKRRRAKQTN